MFVLAGRSVLHYFIRTSLPHNSSNWGMFPRGARSAPVLPDKYLVRGSFSGSAHVRACFADKTVLCGKSFFAKCSDPHRSALIRGNRSPCQVFRLILGFVQLRASFAKNTVLRAGS